MSEAVKPAIERADVAFAYISEALLVEPRASDNALSHSSWEQALEKAGPRPSSLAYVKFTSGSTGNPKGVMIEHRGIVRLMHESTAARQLSPAHRIAHLANIVFDASAWEIFGALLKGRTLVCIDNITLLDPRLLSEAFVQKQVEAACMTPSLLRRCWDSSPNAIEVLQVLHIAGEVLPTSDAIQARNSIGRHTIRHSRCATQPAVYNAYGPTENSVASTIYSIPLGDLSDAVPIGQPIDNSGAYVMDSQQRLVSAGVIGELVVTGDGLARGYLQPSMDTGRFIEIDDPGIPYSQRRRIRAYRTGDVARMRPDGQLECLGRADQQVKLRGHRIELASVEHATARNCKNVKEAVAVIRPSVASDQEFKMITFITVTTTAPAFNEHNEHDVTGNDRVAAEALVLDKLRKQLPSYMVPTQIVLLDSMPLNVNGKTDRRHLEQSARLLLPQRMTELIGGERSRSRPSNHVEAAVCKELAGLLALDVDHVGPADNFFDLGGHSLLALRLVARISRQVGVYISVKEVFDFPVLSDLARRISELESSVLYEQVPRLGHSQHTELSSAQSRLWFLDQLGSSKTWYLMPIALRLLGKLNIDALETALQAVEHRHESLRTTFEQHNGVPMQVVHPFHLRKLTVTKVVLQKHATEALQQEQEQPFDLAAGPIWRARLF
jgi:amino acid adenylation domain-containing protein